MVVLTLCGLLALAVALIGLLVWVVLRLFRIKKGRKTVKVALVAYLVAAPVAVFLGLPLFASSMIAQAGTRPMDLRLDVNPATFGRQFEEVEFPSRDEVRLAGWWMPGQTGAPAFILCHGLFRDRKEVVERACRLNELGFAALAFDLRRHGSSEGPAVTMGYMERLDVLGAEDFARAHGATQIIALGVSMGASATIEAGPDFGEDVRAIVADSPFLSLRETVNRHVGLFLGLPAFPFANVFNWNLARIGHFQASQLDAAVALGRMRKIPMLLIYGKDDNRMPAATAEAVFAAIPHSMKEIVFFEGATHGAAFRSDPEKYIQTVVSFLDKYGLGVAGSAQEPEKGIP